MSAAPDAPPPSTGDTTATSDAQTSGGTNYTAMYNSMLPEHRAAFMQVVDQHNKTVEHLNAQTAKHADEIRAKNELMAAAEKNNLTLTQEKELADLRARETTMSAADLINRLANAEMGRLPEKDRNSIASKVVRSMCSAATTLKDQEAAIEQLKSYVTERLDELARRPEPVDAEAAKRASDGVVREEASKRARNLTASNAPDVPDTSINGASADDPEAVRFARMMAIQRTWRGDNGVKNIQLFRASAHLNPDQLPADVMPTVNIGSTTNMAQSTFSDGSGGRNFIHISHHVPDSRQSPHNRIGVWDETFRIDRKDPPNRPSQFNYVSSGLSPAMQGASSPWSAQRIIF